MIICNHQNQSFYLLNSIISHGAGSISWSLIETVLSYWVSRHSTQVTLRMYAKVHHDQKWDGEEGMRDRVSCLTYSSEHLARYDSWSLKFDVTTSNDIRPSKRPGTPQVELAQIVLPEL